MENIVEGQILIQPTSNARVLGGSIVPERFVSDSKTQEGPISLGSTTSYPMINYNVRVVPIKAGV